MLGLTNQYVCSGCGPVDSKIASNARGPGFEFSHQQLLLNTY